MASQVNIREIKIPTIKYYYSNGKVSKIYILLL